MYTVSLWCRCDGVARTWWTARCCGITGISRIHRSLSSHPKTPTLKFSSGIIRPHRMHSNNVAYCRSRRTFCGPSVCLSVRVSHTGVPYENGWTDLNRSRFEMPFGGRRSSMSPKNHVIDWVYIGSTWRVRWLDVYGGCDAACNYHYCSTGRFQLLAWWPGSHSRILSGIQRAAQTVLGVYLKCTRY